MVPLASVTWICCAPEITWLLVMMWPSVSRIAPEPLAVPLLSTVWMETTELDTLLATDVQSTDSPLLTVAEPEPDLLESTLVSELVVGTFTQPLVIAV